MKKNLILHLWSGKAKLVWLLVTLSLLLASAFSAPIASAQSASDFIDDACEVVTFPRLPVNYELFWDPECQSYVWGRPAQFIEFVVSEESQYRITTNSGSLSSFINSDRNFISLYDASGDTIGESALESEVGTYYFGYSSSVIANLTPGTYSVRIVALDEELSHPVPFEFSISELMISDDPFRPIQGGVGIVASREGVCTLGFAATVRLMAEEIKGVVTNSHCTDVLGRQDDTQLSQGDELITKRLMGERADSNLLNWNSPTSTFETPLDRLACSTNCQYSDAAFFELEEGFDASHSITRPKMINTNTPQWMANNDRSLHPLTQHLGVDFASPSFEIVGIGRARMGDTVHKIGRTTGWTTGEVTSVCEPLTVNYNEGLVDLFCQDTFEHLRGNVVSGSGDSGAPIFKCVTASGHDDPGCQNSQRVILVGILHSSPEDACSEAHCYSSSVHFSPMDNVLREFNKSFESRDACWVLTSAGNCYSPPTQSPQRSNTCQLDTLSMGAPASGRFGDDCFSLLPDSEGNARYFNLRLTGETELQIAVRGADSAKLISAGDRNYGEVVGELEMGAISAQLPAADYILEVVGRGGRGFSVLAADAEQGPLQLEDPNKEPDPPQAEPLAPMPDLPPPNRPPETDTGFSLGNDTLLVIGLLALVIVAAMPAACPAGANTN